MMEEFEENKRMLDKIKQEREEFQRKLEDQ
jgi:hypothetical protein